MRPNVYYTGQTNGKIELEIIKRKDFFVQGFVCEKNGVGKFYQMSVQLFPGLMRTNERGMPILW